MVWSTGKLSGTTKTALSKVHSLLTIVLSVYRISALSGRMSESRSSARSRAATIMSALSSTPITERLCSSWHRMPLGRRRCY